MTVEEVVEQIKALKREAGEFVFRAAMKKINRPRVDEARGKKKLFPAHVLMAAAEKQGWVCPACGLDLPRKRYLMHGDHVNPNRVNGLNDADNCQALHVKCNLKKSSKSMFEVSKTSGRTVLDQINRK
jgi:hypothetical protein